MLGHGIAKIHAVELGGPYEKVTFYIAFDVVS
jgi:hypothetical protein